MNEDKIINTIIEHKENLDWIRENMFSKEEGRKMMDVLEGIATICKNIQEDHVFAIEWLKRLQNQMEKQEDEIRQIKLRLQMA